MPENDFTPYLIDLRFWSGQVGVPHVNVIIYMVFLFMLGPLRDKAAGAALAT